MMKEKKCTGILILLVLFAISVGTVSADTIVGQWPAEWAANSQGSNGWSYKYYSEANGNYYTLPWDSSGGVYGWASDLKITSSYVVSNSAATLHPALVWQSDVAGEVKITGSAARTIGTISGADGCLVYIFVNDQKVFQESVTNGVETEVFDVTVPDIKVGDSVYFRIDCAGNNWGDKIYWTPTITSVPEPTTMGLIGIGGLALLRRRKKA